MDTMVDPHPHAQSVLLVCLHFVQDWVATMIMPSISDALRPSNLRYVGLDHPVSEFDVSLMGTELPANEDQQLLFIHTRQMLELECVLLSMFWWKFHKPRLPHPHTCIMAISRRPEGPGSSAYAWALVAVVCLFWSDPCTNQLF